MAYPFLDYPGPIPFAHRGGALEGLENTIPAFEAALALGYHYLETDVQMTADGVLLISHDDELSRTCGRPGRISELPYAEVKTALVGGREPIPLLEDVLGQFPQARINLEPKTAPAVAPFVEVVRRTACLDRICVGSFYDNRLRQLRDALGPALCSSMGPAEIARWISASWLPGGWGTPDVPVAQAPIKSKGIPVVTTRSVENAHRHGIKVHVWTINTADEMDRLLDLGVDGIMTDEPTVLKAVLQRRGQWYS
jgi:glycerophosphoryl diester phosphodiesterase